MTTVADYFSPIDMHSDCVDAQEAMFGTEYEIEYIKHIDYKHPLFQSTAVTIVDDHSLRNSGKEFITRPLNFTDSIKCFETLHQTLQLGPDPYSARTSTHVHMNVLNLEVDQLKHLLLMYALLEPVFFAYVGDKRKHNIHCVPLNYTMLPKYYSMNLEHIIEAWSKYTAFNMKPVPKQGTVEFRHLYGTGDIEVYTRWLKLLQALYLAAKTLPTHWLQTKLIEGMSSYVIREHVLGYDSWLISPIQEEMKQSTIDVKLAFV